MIQDLGGYRLLLVTRVSVARWLPVKTGYHNFGLRLVSGYHWLLNLVTKIGYELAHLHRLPVTSGYQKIKIFLVTR